MVRKEEIKKKLRRRYILFTLGLEGNLAALGWVLLPFIIIGSPWVIGFMFILIYQWIIK